MPSILDTPVPEPPEPLSDLDDDDFQVNVGIRHRDQWRQYMEDIRKHAQELHAYATDVSIRFDALERQGEVTAGQPPSADPSEPPAARPADTETQGQIWVKEISLYVVGVALGKM